ncbi:MAG: nucleoside-diphosphate kinase [Phycisphaerae bacterium]|mgnify:CR=1 FL=1|nr:nucleoside-diphosphate kinase [Phycisphaerae bacterium]
MERSLVILKPDAVQRGLVGRLVARFEEKGLKLIAMKMVRLTRQTAETHYGEHKGKDFYEPLVAYIISGAVVLLVVEGPSAVSVVRTMMGPTSGITAPPGTIRGDFAVATRYNLVHGSDSAQSAEREIALFFKPDELVEYDRAILDWSWQC